MMSETEQTAGSSPALVQTAVRTGPPSTTRGVPSDISTRFLGDGVRYKAKLIGIDSVPDAQGEKMCWDSMMKLKGFEAAARKQGKHKLRVWLKISSSGLKILDERTGIVFYDHDRNRISSLTKDESDPRALAYIYQHQDSYVLFYIKMANQADPVLLDIKEVCQRVDHEASDESAETQNISLVVLNEASAPPAEVVFQGEALEQIFSPRPESSSGQTNHVSSSSELLEVFSPQLEEPLSPFQTSCSSQPESPQPALSNAQILSIFPKQPVGGSPYNSPPFSPTTMPWGQQGLLGNQWTGHWPTVPGMPPWAASGVTAPPAGGQLQAGGVATPQLGFMMDGGSGGGPAVPLAPNDFFNPLKSVSTPTTQTGSLGSPSFNSQSLL